MIVFVGSERESNDTQVMKKKNREEMVSSPQRSLADLQLKFKPYSQSQVEWRTVAERGAGNRRSRFEEVGIWWI